MRACKHMQHFHWSYRSTSPYGVLTTKWQIMLLFNSVYGEILLVQPHGALLCECSTVRALSAHQVAVIITNDRGSCMRRWATLAEEGSHWGGIVVVQGFSSCFQSTKYGFPNHRAKCGVHGIACCYMHLKIWKCIDQYNRSWFTRKLKANTATKGTN